MSQQFEKWVKRLGYLSSDRIKDFLAIPFPDEESANIAAREAELAGVSTIVIPKNWDNEEITYYYVMEIE